MNHQTQFSGRLNTLNGGSLNFQNNGQGNNRGLKNLKSQVTRQTQPLTASQLVNLQQAQEAQFARDKLNAKKQFSLEDDLEFYPNQIETKKPMNNRNMMNPGSPYSTPTRTAVFNGHQQQMQRMNGYISPGHVINSPQHQQRVLNHTQIFNSPQNVPIRRLDLSNISSPAYQSSQTRHW